VVKIGLIAPFEELYRADGYEALHAVKLAISQRNAAGGVAGRRIALVALNDNGRPEEARLQAAKLALDGDVVAVVGPVQTATAALGQALSANGLPWVSLVELDSAQLAGGVSVALSPEALGGAAVAALDGAPGVNSILLYGDWQEAVAGAQAAATSLGMPLSAAPAQGANPARGAASEGVIWLGDAEHGARLAAALGQDAVLIGGSAVGSHSFAGRAGGSPNVHWISAGPGADQLPSEFVDAYRTLAGSDPGPQAALAYDATNLLLDALELAGQERQQPSRTGVQNALLQLSAQSWQGVSGMMRWQDSCQPSPCGQRLDAAPSVHSLR
jgi:ABC-type branched-subunit amino acid transport system substrate-binding protein